MPEPNRDHWGRYILTHPDTGQEIHWTRATTLAETLEDTYNLTKWKMRSVAFGLGQRPDLLAMVQSHTMEDKKALDRVADQAMDAAGAGGRANLGTALHRMCERLDSGEKFNVPAAHQPDIAAYNALKTRHRIETRADYCERITCVTAIPDLPIAGTPYRIVRRDGVIYIADLKTGNDLKFGWGKIEIQLALYSRGRALWNAETGQWESMPPVDQDRGIVIHVPAGEGTERGEAYWVDLQRGWYGAGLSGTAREWRKGKGPGPALSDAA